MDKVILMNRRTWPDECQSPTGLIVHRHLVTLGGRVKKGTQSKGTPKPRVTTIRAKRGSCGGGVVEPADNKEWSFFKLSATYCWVHLSRFTVNIMFILPYPVLASSAAAEADKVVSLEINLSAHLIVQQPSVARRILLSSSRSVNQGSCVICLFRGRGKAVTMKRGRSWSTRSLN